MLKCENCKKEFDEKITLEDGKVLWLRSRKFCPDCSPIKGGNNRTYIIDIPDGHSHCVRCKTNKPSDEFYTRKSGKPLSYCIECQKEVKTLKMQENLERIVEERGGSCADCGGVYPMPVYDFFNEGKTYQLSRVRNMSLSKIKSELEHYEMLCKNCCALRIWQS